MDAQHCIRFIFRFCTNIFANFANYCQHWERQRKPICTWMKLLLFAFQSIRPPTDNNDSAQKKKKNSTRFNWQWSANSVRWKCQKKTRTRRNTEKKGKSEREITVPSKLKINFIVETCFFSPHFHLTFCSPRISN